MSILSMGAQGHPKGEGVEDINEISELRREINC
jgi:hypothetical protein